MSNLLNNLFQIESITESDIHMIKTLLKKFEYTDIGFKKLNEDPLRRSLGECIVLDYKLNKLDSKKNIFNLFYLGKSVSNSSLSKTIEERIINRLKNMNILTRDNKGFIRSNIMIIPYKNYYFACDFMFRYLEEYSYEVDNQIENLVYPVSRDSIDLWQSLLKNYTQSVLDIGTGCGVLAILISSLCKEVTGTDINSRAINFAQFNSHLNQVKNSSFYTCNLFSPVKSNKFDLIISNPPTLITQSDNKKRYYENGGSNGYQIMKKIIQNLPEKLNVGGFCQMVVVFFETFKGMKIDLIEKWISKKNSNYKILFLKLYETDIYQYSWIKCQDKLQLGWKVYQEEIIRLLNKLSNLGIKKVQYGILTIESDPDKKFSFSEKEFISNIPLQNKPLDLIRNYFF